MGRPSKHKVGNFWGKLEVLDILPNNVSGQHVSLRCFCHYCNNETIVNGGLIHKFQSCGCQKHNSETWKSKGGPKTKPWQLEEGIAARNNLEYQYKRGAQKRNLDYDLTTKEFVDIVTGSCFYCGDALTNVQKGQGKTSGNFSFTGIDRVDSSKGYTVENSVPCCWMCNNMKGTTDKESFVRHIKKMYNYFNGEK